MNSLKNGNSRESVEAFFMSQVNTDNAFEQKRWETSLAIRGLPPQSMAKQKVDTNIMPGVIV